MALLASQFKFVDITGIIGIRAYIDDQLLVLDPASLYDAHTQIYLTPGLAGVYTRFLSITLIDKLQVVIDGDDLDVSSLTSVDFATVEAIIQAAIVVAETPAADLVLGIPVHMEITYNAGLDRFEAAIKISNLLPAPAILPSIGVEITSPDLTGDNMSLHP